MTKLDISDGEREIFETMHALAIDKNGNEVLCGLSLTETREYLTLAKQKFHGNATLRNRYLELQSKYEEARKRLEIAAHEALISGKIN